MSSSSSTPAAPRKTRHGSRRISVAIEDVAQEDWAEKVYKPDILGKPETLYKKPGHNPLT